MTKISRLLSLFSGLLLSTALGASADFSAPPINISNSGSGSFYPKIAHETGSSNVFVCWLEVDPIYDRLYFSKSTDEGASWSLPVDLTKWKKIRTGVTEQDCSALSICVNEPYVHIVTQWRMGAAQTFEIFYLRSDDLGETWDAWRQLTFNSTPSRMPDIAGRGEYVHVVYVDDWAGNSDIIYKRIAGYGAGAVDQTRRLTYSAGESLFPRLAVTQSGSTVNIVYEDDFNGVRNLFYKHIDDAGSGLLTTRQLTFGTTYNGLPDIVTSSGADDSYVYIVYQALWPGNREIMYKRLSEYGHPSGATYTLRLTFSPGESRGGAIDFDGLNNTVHVAYHEAETDYCNVMYRKLTNFGGAGFSGERVTWWNYLSTQPTVAALGDWALITWQNPDEIYVIKGF